MHTSWQWSVTPFQGFASSVATSKYHCLAKQKKGPPESALFWFFFFSFVFCFILFCFFKAKEPKPRALGCKTALGKTGRGSNKTTVLFSCFVLPCLFSPEAITAWYKSLQGAGKSSCGSLEARTQQSSCLPNTARHRENNNSTGRLCIYFSKTTSQTLGCWGTALHGSG